MRYIYVILTVLILSSVCNAESSPNAPPAATLPASPNTPPAVQPTPPPTTIQPIISHSDETIRAERDAYKEIVKAHQETLTTIKWAIGIIGSLILVLVGYVVFKNNKEYKDALEQAKEARNDAKEACKEARHWEAEAKQILGSIKEQVKEELENIKKQGKGSIENIVKQTHTQMRISELWNEALRLRNEGKYEEACDRYSKIETIAGDKPTAELYFNWGNALFKLAKLKDDEKLLEQACHKYEQAINIKPDMHEAYNGWGLTLGELARIKNDEKLLEQACEKLEQSFKIKPDEYLLYVIWGGILGLWAKVKSDEKLFKQSCQKFERAIRIDPNRPEAYNYWGASFLYLAQVKIGKPEYDGLLKQAEEKCLKAESLKPGFAAYNLACICAVRGNKPECKKWLLTGQETGTLLTRKYAMEDNDLESVRNEQWFKEIKWKGEK